jgi:hypothetical protein
MDDEAISLTSTILEIASPRWARNDGLLNFFNSH